MWCDKNITTQAQLGHFYPLYKLRKEFTIESGRKRTGTSELQYETGANM